MPLDEATALRLLRAVVTDINNWVGQLAVIEQHAAPWNKGRLRHLAANLTQAQGTLARLLEDDAEP